MLLAVECQRYVVTLYGMCNYQPPLDPAGFEGFAWELAAGDLQELLGDAEALDAPQGLRFPANRRLRYERLDELPAGLLVAGDAAAMVDDHPHGCATATHAGVAPVDPTHPRVEQARAEQGTEKDIA